MKRASVADVVNLGQEDPAVKETRRRAVKYWLRLASRNRYLGSFDDWWHEIGGVFDDAAKGLLTWDIDG